MAMTASSMGQRIKSAVEAVPPVQVSDPAAIAQYQLALFEAISQGIIEEIVANSELVPLTTDSGTAGAGIITGRVK